MNLSCVICSDLFDAASEVYVTQCGHMFHLVCVMNWIVRSKTCPQCRCKSTEQTIHRVYFNLANTDGFAVDAGTLLNKLENVQFQLSLKEKDIKANDEKFKRVKEQNDSLRREIVELESKIRVNESAIHALKDQIHYFKSKAKESDKLSEQVTKLKRTVKDMENVESMINGTREQVNEILKNEDSIESLALLAATLKKSLLDAERKKRGMEHNMKKAQNDAFKFKREVTTLETQNSELRKEMQYIKENLERENRHLKTKIVNLNKTISEGSLDIRNTVKRVTKENPANFNRHSHSSSTNDFLNDTVSTPMPEKIKKIIDSDSPYLPIKSSNVPIDYTSILNTKMKVGSSAHALSIFKPATKSLDTIKQAKTKDESMVAYNGLGSSSKEDIFPSSRPPQTGLKRQKSSSSVPTNKFRKLAPTSTKNKVSNFFPSTQ